jgi:hypothetical protein
MRKPKLRYAPGCSPEMRGLAGMPLAWDWQSEKINKKTLSEFAEYIYWLVGCDNDQIKEDAVALLQKLVDKVRYERE